jgi:hypothetical protein
VESVPWAVCKCRKGCRVGGLQGKGRKQTSLDAGKKIKKKVNKQIKEINKSRRREANKERKT